jgi:hypothetical protein
MRKLKLFHEFDRLSPADLQRVHDSLSRSTYRKTIDFLRDEFGIVISYGRLQRYYQHWQQTLLIKTQSGVQIGVNEFIQFQNGEALPFSDLTHHLIYKAAFIQAAQPENHTPAKLLALQRIANNPFNQEIAREKLDLEKRKLVLREKQLIHRAWRDAQDSLFARSQSLSGSNIAPAFPIACGPAHSNIVPANFRTPAQTLALPNVTDSFSQTNTA